MNGTLVTQGWGQPGRWQSRRRDSFPSRRIVWFSRTVNVYGLPLQAGVSNSGTGMWSSENAEHHMSEFNFNSEYSREFLHAFRWGWGNPSSKLEEKANRNTQKWLPRGTDGRMRQWHQCSPKEHGRNKNRCEGRREKQTTRPQQASNVQGLARDEKWGKKKFQSSNTRDKMK